MLIKCLAHCGKTAARLSRRISYVHDVTPSRAVASNAGEAIQCFDKVLVGHYPETAIRCTLLDNAIKLISYNPVENKGGNRMKKATQTQILDKIIQGIENAQSTYKKGSESLISWGPEYLITASIYESLLSTRALSNSLSLEDKVRDIEEYRRDRRGRKPKYFSRRSRCDMVIWHTKDDAPRVVIEVKRWANDKDVIQDAVRVGNLTRKVNRLEFSVVASCLSEKLDTKGNAEHKLRRTIRKTYREIRTRLEKEGLRVSLVPPLSKIEPVPIAIPVYDSEESKYKAIWCPICFKIYR